MSLKLVKLADELGDEKEMNRGLRDNQRKWQDKVALLEADLARKDKVRTQGLELDLSDNCQDLTVGIGWVHGVIPQRVQGWFYRGYQGWFHSGYQGWF